MTTRLVRMITEAFHRDDEGRPLREGRTPSELLRPGEIEYRRCPFAGSRFEHANPMNVSAFKQMGGHWDAILGALAELRHAYATRRGAYGPDVLDLWRVSQLGSALPWYFLFRDDAPPPAYAASLAKATLGMGIWAQRLVARTLVEGWEPPAWTARTILASVEETGTLVGDTEVCAGPEPMLLQFFEAFAIEAPVPQAIVTPALLRFGAHYANLKLAVWIYFLARRFLYADVAAAHGDVPGLAALRASGVEPPDFFLVEPADLAAVTPPQRGAWLRRLATLVVPFAPDASDLPVRDGVLALAEVMAQGGAPAEVFARLDAHFAVIADAVERGLGGAASLDAAARDRIIGGAPRALFAQLGATPRDLGPNAGGG